MTTRQRKTAIRRRGGFMMVETLCALAFLLVAAAAILQTQRMALEFERNAFRQLREELTLDEAADFLNTLRYEEIERLVTEGSDTIPEIETLSIQSESFEAGPRKGIHLTIGLSKDKTGLRRHLWRWEP
ncbi:MAG: hypothetical protein AAF802_17360 [Planctomycetota bacterium]